MKIITCCLLLLLLSCSTPRAQQKFNGNFEVLDKPGHPAGWDLTFYKQNTYEVKLDSVIKKQGKYAVSITSNNTSFQSNAIDYTINRKLTGQRLILIGNIKTENVTDGYAGLWIRTDGGDHQLEIDIMDGKGITGTTDWKEYMIELPYDELNATSVHLGALLTGKGKMWVDSLRFYVDEIPIDEVKSPTYAASSDSLYAKHSGIDTLYQTPQNLKYLTLIGQTWGFLKYYHPAIAAGKYNWDAELFKVLPGLLQSKNDAQFSEKIEKWIDQLGMVPVCKKCAIQQKGEVFIQPDYGDLFTNATWSSTLIQKMEFIRDNSNNKKHYYISFLGALNPSFDHERSYDERTYPDAGLRLLALYRYWSVIQYFNPNRKLTDENWNSILPAFLPQIIGAKDQHEYTQVLVKLITSIHDSHGFIQSSVFNQDLGKYILPVGTKYVDQLLIVTEQYIDSLQLKEQIRPGDVILQINGDKVEQLIKKYLPVTSASSFSTAMRDMPALYLLRSKEKMFELTLQRDEKIIHVQQQGIIANTLKSSLYSAKSTDKGFALLSQEIGYIKGNKFKRNQMDSIRTVFAQTKGLIVDMRGYPIDELAHSVGDYLKSESSPFVKFTHGSIDKPGSFLMTPLFKNGKKGKAYPGKVVVIVNEVTQSNAEFVTMAFQSAANVKVIGSSSAGADGNVSFLFLPGGFKTWFSGLGVFYPDGTNAQRVGVKIDEVVKPTPKGIQEGKDELLERAKAMILY